ncbi:SGNH/GDSL hydrolase family protein [uncultured Mucilaginibacter sp.]|uniref:SGNH/GDSL hydrolase family protein n=1 Tax=uncultured Mucilaginibacter sp. TaxID=797541 RepID=UPI0026308858|nr:SGNH/GDSL hydrolase family protein [uncultured Mucilaginibacter sp.]
MKKRLLLMLLLPAFFWSPKVSAQQKHAFYDEIEAFKKQDSIHPPPKNGIVFIGSSSLRKWTDLEKTFAAYQAINRGFGGSTLTDAIFYVNNLVDPYQPRQIVIYSGENDIAEGNVSAETILNRFKTLFTLIRQKLPLVPVAFISIKPSPSRAKFRQTIIESNQLIKKYLHGQPKTTFINIYDLMLDNKKQMRPELYVEDQLHMNERGYEIWTKAIEPYLIKP